MNYLIVINKDNLIDTSYYKNLELVWCGDVLGESIKVEKLTYNNYIKLKEYLKSRDIPVRL